MTVQRSGGATPRIRVAFTGSGHSDAGVVDILDPVALRLVEPPGRVPSLEIHHGSGLYTRVRFRNVPLPELLDGIAPGEAEPLPPA